MTRPRATDDFPMIRARMEELRRERARPRATDDFAMGAGILCTTRSAARPPPRRPRVSSVGRAPISPVQIAVCVMGRRRLGRDGLQRIGDGSSGPCRPVAIPRPAAF